MRSEHSKLSDWSKAVRNSTLKRLKAVPKGYQNWRSCDDAMSIADIARHIANADIWLFRKLNQPELKPIIGYVGEAGDLDWEQYLDLIGELERLSADRAELLSGMDLGFFDGMISDERFGGQTKVWWVIVRGNIDHEIHHQGQIAAYLRLLKAKT